MAIMPHISLIYCIFNYPIGLDSFFYSRLRRYYLYLIIILLAPQLKTYNKHFQIIL